MREVPPPVPNRRCISYQLFRVRLEPWLGERRRAPVGRWPCVGSSNSSHPRHMRDACVCVWECSICTVSLLVLFPCSSSRLYEGRRFLARPHRRSEQACLKRRPGRRRGSTSPRPAQGFNSVCFLSFPRGHLRLFRFCVLVRRRKAHTAAGSLPVACVCRFTRNSFLLC